MDLENSEKKETNQNDTDMDTNLNLFVMVCTLVLSDYIELNVQT